MEYEFDDIMGFDKLGLYYEVHMAGADGENFNYSVYFADGVTDEKFAEVDKAVSDFFNSFDEEEDLGYFDVSNEDDKVNIYLDLGGSDPDNEDTAIKGILKALNKVSGIKSVIVNEDVDF
ncbi:MAG: hypothetical protein NC240_07985 [Clostridium sp.]|nr:hypothetical protein [Clostridium sp.]